MVTVGQISICALTRTEISDGDQIHLAQRVFDTEIFGEERKDFRRCLRTSISEEVR